MTQSEHEVRKRLVLDAYAPLFTPRNIAVVGASTKGQALANLFVRRIRSFGFEGNIYPIHPTASAVEGLTAYRTLADTPEPVDYAYVAVSADRVPEVLRAGRGRVRFAQVVSSGFGESDARGEALEAAAVEAAHVGGMRLIGPNCMGLYTPRGKITYTEVAPKETGNIGVISQSGGLGTDVIRRGLIRGLKFSGLVSIGNSADVTAANLLEYFLADEGTKVIGLYLETSRHGRRVFETLRAARATKPVVILKGGTTADGAVAASSHTGSLAGDYRIWQALARQTGAVLVQTLTQFIDVLLAFSYLRPSVSRPTKKVVLFGNGGGATVLGTDSFARCGLTVPRFPESTLVALRSLPLEPGTSIQNPIDAPVGMMQQDEGRIAERILDVALSDGDYDALIMHLSMPAFSGRTNPVVLDNLVGAALRARARHANRGHFVLVLRSDGQPAIDERKREFRDKAVSLGVPVYDELENAAAALAAVRAHEAFVISRIA